MPPQEERTDFFKTLFDQSPFAMQIFSPDGTLLKANRAWETLWKIHLSHSGNPYNLFKDNQSGKIGVTTLFQKALAGESVILSDVEYDPKLSGLSGEKLFLHVHMLPLEQIAGEVEGVVCIVEDVTDRKQAELELKQSQKRLEEQVQTRTKHLEALLQFSTDLSALSGSQKIFHAVTKGVKDLLQFDYSTIFILSRESGKLVMRDTIGFPKSMVGSFMLLADEGLPSLVAREKHEAMVLDFNKETRFSVPDIIFNERITSSLAVPMMNKNEVIGVLIGHTRQKRAFTASEISLYQSFANQAAVSILNTMNLLSLIESEKKLRRSQKMEAIGLMAGGVAHDLNNILSGIVSYPQLLLRQLQEDSPFRGPIETIQQAGNRAAAVTADLITVARGVASSREIKNINDIIVDSVKSPEYVQLVKQSEHIQFIIDFDENIFNINCSPVHIGKVLFNLVLNASEAIKLEGQIKITTRNQYIDTALKECVTVLPGEYVVLSVADNGPGISKDDIERIFEPFYTKKVMGRSGTGLGLAVVWNTVLDHNGYIDVSSCDQETLFEVYFPAIRKSEQEQVNAHTSFNTLKGNGETVLVIDDVASQREIACGLLKELGYQPESVPNGEKAVVFLQRNKADMLILDMIMEPGINGRETYEKIIAIHPGQKAIIASGYSETSEVKKIQELGAGKYIKKPYTMESLGLAIKDELASKCSQARHL